MKKTGSIQTNKADVLWKQIMLSPTFFPLIDRCRESLGIPRYGFETRQDFLAWDDQVDREKEKSVLTLLRDEVKGTLPDTHPGFTGLKIAAFRYLWFNDTNISLDPFLVSGIRVRTMTSTERRLGRSLNEVGVYIEIDADTPIEDLKEFVKTRSSCIKQAQHLIKQETDYKKRPRVRLSRKALRDLFIYRLNGLTREELKNEGGGISTYKEMQIAEIMKNQPIFPEDKEMNENTIRGIIGRMGKRAKIRPASSK